MSDDRDIRLCCVQMATELHVNCAVGVDVLKTANDFYNWILSPSAQVTVLRVVSKIDEQK